IVGYRFHLIALTVYSAGAATVSVYYRIDVDIKTKNIFIEIGVKIHSAVNTIDVPSETSSAIGIFCVIESEASHIGIDVTVLFTHKECARIHGGSARIALATRARQSFSNARSSAF